MWIDFLIQVVLFKEIKVTVVFLLAVKNRVIIHGNYHLFKIALADSRRNIFTFAYRMIKIHSCLAISETAY